MDRQCLTWRWLLVHLSIRVVRHRSAKPRAVKSRFPNTWRENTKATCEQALRFSCRVNSVLMALLLLKQSLALVLRKYLSSRDSGQ
jgi:hypothetical protein